MKINLKEIAKMAGVSITTVSRVYNNKANGKMNKKTYNRVKKIIEITGYSPNPLASALRNGLTKLIAIIIPDGINPYYSQLSYNIENEAYKIGYLTLVCNSDSNIAREKKYISILKKHKVCGILLCSAGLMSREIETLLKLEGEIKIVLLDEEINGFKGDIVLGNDYCGGYMAAEYLYNLGHKNIIIILGPKKLISTQKRLKGFLGFFSEINIEYDKNLIIEGNYSIDSASNELQSMIKKKKSFTAIFSLNDLMAIGAIQTLRENDIKVPDEVSVLGYDNIYLDQFFSPKLTSIATPLGKLSKIAVGKIVQGNKNAESNEKRCLIMPTLIERESCKKI